MNSQTDLIWAYILGLTLLWGYLLRLWLQKRDIKRHATFDKKTH